MQRGCNVAPIQDGVVKDQNWNLQKKNEHKKGKHLMVKLKKKMKKKQRT
jgi:hypothetical protein